MSITNFVDRRSVLGAAFAMALVQSSNVAIAAKRPKRVLFICQFGSVKSPIARELFRRRAKERGIAVIAWSRGIHLRHILHRRFWISLKSMVSTRKVTVCKS
jgi:hypothetical protein